MTTERIIRISEIPESMPLERALEEWAVPVMCALAFWVIVSALCAWPLVEERKK